MDEQRVLYTSICSAHTICRERWWLSIMEAERDAQFDKIAAETDTEAARVIMDGNAANVGSSESFVPGCNEHEAGPSTSIMDLTSTTDVRPHDRLWRRVGNGRRNRPRPASVGCGR